MIIATMFLGAIVGLIAGVIGWVGFGIGFSGALLIYLAASLAGASLGIVGRMITAQPTQQSLLTHS